MDDFSIGLPGVANYFGVVPSPTNYIQPGKRPMSSTCPSLILNQHGDVVFSIGAAGGTRITSSAVFVRWQDLISAIMCIIIILIVYLLCLRICWI